MPSSKPDSSNPALSKSMDVSKQITSQDVSDMNKEAASDLEMADLLSQYLEPAGMFLWCWMQ